MNYEICCGSVVFNDNKVLIIKHKYGHISFPKGHVEDNESEIDTAIREVKEETGIDIECITGGLDEYPITANKAAEYLKDNDLDLIVVFGVPHAFPIEEFDVESVAVTDGPRLVEPLKELGYTHVVAELDAHSKTLGTDKIVFSDFGEMIRAAIGWLEE